MIDGQGAASRASDRFFGGGGSAPVKARGGLELVGPRRVRVVSERGGGDLGEGDVPGQDLAQFMVSLLLDKVSRGQL